MLGTAYKEYRPVVEIKKLLHPMALSNRMRSPDFLFDLLGTPTTDEEADNFNVMLMANSSSASLCRVKIAISVRHPGCIC